MLHAKARASVVGPVEGDAPVVAAEEALLLAISAKVEAVVGLQRVMHTAVLSVVHQLVAMEAMAVASAEVTVEAIAEAPTVILEDLQASLHGGRPLTSTNHDSESKLGQQKSYRLPRPIVQPARRYHENIFLSVTAFEHSTLHD